MSWSTDGGFHVRNGVPEKTVAAPAFSSSALNIAPSPPLTSSLNSRRSATSIQESRYFRQAALFRWCRVIVAVLLVGVSGAIVGCESYILHNYNATNLKGAWFLPLWPQNIDLRPTIGLLVPAAVILATNLLYFIVALIPSPRSRTLYLNILFALTSAIGLIAAVVGLALTTYFSNNSAANSRDTISSWTCRLYNGAKSFNADATTLQLPTYQRVSAPSGFGQFCHESQAAYWIMIPTLLFGVLGVAVAIAGLWTDARIAKLRRERNELEKWQRPISA